jgi:hypothetical protein
MSEFTAHINQLIHATDSTKDFEVETGDGTVINACFVDIENHKENNLPRYAVLFKDATYYSIDENDEECEESISVEEAVRELFRPVSPQYSHGDYCEMVAQSGMHFPVCWKTGELFSFMPKHFLK